MASWTRSSGIELDPPVLAPDEARRQREAERAAAGLAVPGGETALAEEVELVFGHRALQAEQQPVVHQARVVDTVRIDDQGAGQRAEIDQMMPVAPIARQPRRLEAEHRADGTGAEFGDQALEAGARGEAGARAAEVVVDHGDGREAGGARGIGEGVLPLLALEVAEHLRHRRLPDVDDGATRQMFSADLGAHRRPPRCPGSPSSWPWPPAAARRAPRAAPPRAEPWAVGPGPARRSGGAETAMVGDGGAPGISWDAGHPQHDPGSPAPRHLLEDRRQLQQRLESDPRRAQIHPGAGRRIAHPAGQLAQPPRPVLDQNDVKASPAPAFTDTEPPAKQGVPGVLDRREDHFVCGMTAVLPTG